MNGMKVERAPGARFTLWAWSMTTVLSLVKVVGAAKDMPWVAVLAPLWFPHVVGAITCAIGVIVIAVRTAAAGAKG